MNINTFSIMLVILLVGACSHSPTSSNYQIKKSYDISAIDWSHAKLINVDLSEFSFAPDHISLHLNQPYQLHLRNVGRGSHNFDAPKFFATVMIRDDTGSLKIQGSGSVELASGNAIDVFFVPQKLGSYPLEYSHLLHAIFGMTGNIVVG